MQLIGRVISNVISVNAKSMWCDFDVWSIFDLKKSVFFSSYKYKNVSFTKLC